MFLIWSIEHNSWWKPNQWGYTDDIDQAGIFDLFQANLILENANITSINECAIPASSCGKEVEAHSALWGDIKSANENI